MKIVFATGNSGKLREAQEVLGEGFELVTPTQMGITEDIPETGTTLRANSLQKAQYIKDHCGCDCFADDTGLEVDVLGGAPGIYSARYAGEGHDNKANMHKLLDEIARKEKEASMARECGLDTDKLSRRARFTTVVTLILDSKVHVFTGTMEGEIAICEKGERGFGYDPIFIPDVLPNEDGTTRPNTGRLTLAQISDEEKNAISHRGKAMSAMAQFLKNL